jgi:glutamate-1-semialdehyde 2,1-aminomutase
MCSNRVGSMFTWFFWAGPVTDFQSAAASTTAEFARFHRAMLERGFWFPPSQFEAAFMSAAHTDHDVAETITAAADVFAAATSSR